MTRSPGLTDVIAPYLEKLSQRLGSAKYNIWFDGEVQVCIDEGDENTLTIAVSSQYRADWIRDNFIDEVESSARECFGPDITVQIEVEPIDLASVLSSDSDAASSDDESSASGAHRGGHGNALEQVPPQRGADFPHPERWRATSQRTAPSAPPRKPQTSHRSANFSLDAFIAGPGNDLALHAAIRFAEGESVFNPLCIHGGCGLGKTHVLRGTCERFRERYPDASIRYMTGEDFTNEYIQGVRRNRPEEFRNRIRNYDLLAIDDVHFLSKKQRTQEELLCTFDSMGNSGTRIVFASDEHPKHIAQFHNSLVNRLVSGMVVEVKMPCVETRALIIQRMAEQRGIIIRDEAVAVLADHCCESIREIEGAVTQLQAMLAIDAFTPTGREFPPGGAAHGCRDAEHDDASSRAPIGLILVNRWLSTTQAGAPRRPVRPSDILGVVADRFGIEPRDILSGSRHRRIVLARSLAAYLTRQMTNRSYPEIAQSMKRRNHTTIIACVNRITERLNRNESVDVSLDEPTVDLRALIESLRTLVYRRAATIRKTSPDSIAE